MTTRTAAPRVRNPYEVPAAMLPTLRELTRQASTCTSCALSQQRTKVVFGDGPADAELMIVGESPGRQEDLTGMPFTGALGNVLDKALGDAGLARADVYVTTIVKCLPPGLREPKGEEIRSCSSFLLQQLAVVRPRVVVSLGENAARLLLGRALPLDRISGYRFDLFGHATLIPTHSPLVAMRGNPRAAKAIRRDFAMAAAVLDGRITGSGSVRPEASVLTA